MRRGANPNVAGIVAGCGCLLLLAAAASLLMLALITMPRLIMA